MAGAAVTCALLSEKKRTLGEICVRFRLVYDKLMVLMVEVLMVEFTLSVFVLMSLLVMVLTAIVPVLILLVAILLVTREEPVSVEKVIALPYTVDTLRVDVVMEDPVMVE